MARTHLIRRHLRRVSAWVMGSQTIRRWYTGQGLLPNQAPTHVVQYGIESFEDLRLARTASRPPLTFGFIGALMPHKGVHILIEAFRSIRPDQARLMIWGNPEANPEYVKDLTSAADPVVVRFEGQFSDSEKSSILRSMDVLIIPSVGLESFGIVASEAMSAGVPVIASRRGALEEMPFERGGGTFFEAENASDLRNRIDQLIRRPETIDAWRDQLPATKTWEQHWREIDEIYEELCRSDIRCSGSG